MVHVGARTAWRGQYPRWTSPINSFVNARWFLTLLFRSWSPGWAWNLGFGWPRKGAPGRFFSNSFMSSSSNRSKLSEGRDWPRRSGSCWVGTTSQTATASDPSSSSPGPSCESRWAKGFQSCPPVGRGFVFSELHASVLYMYLNIYTLNQSSSNDLIYSIWIVFVYSHWLGHTIFTLFDYITWIQGSHSQSLQAHWFMMKQTMQCSAAVHGCLTWTKWHRSFETWMGQCAHMHRSADVSIHDLGSAHWAFRSNHLNMRKHIYIYIILWKKCMNETIRIMLVDCFGGLFPCMVSLWQDCVNYLYIYKTPGFQNPMSPFNPLGLHIEAHCLD